MRSLLACGLLAAALPAVAADHTKPTRSIAQAAASAGQFRTLVNLLVATDLLDALKGDGPFIVCAPTDAAFAKLPDDTLESLLKPENNSKLATVLKFHVTEADPNAKTPFRLASLDKSLGYGRNTLATTGGGNFYFEKGAWTVNGVRIRSEVPCRNGVIFVVDEVLTPEQVERSQGLIPAGNAIPAVAKRAGTFTTLLAALKAAELAEVLGGDGPFTVFAPTDAAFKKLPEGAVADLLKPENKAKLVRLLKYHVVAGKVSAKDAVAAESAKTLQGSGVRVRIADGRLRINDSDVVKTDVPASNGVIHVLDTVLTPPKSH